MYRRTIRFLGTGLFGGVFGYEEAFVLLQLGFTSVRQKRVLSKAHVGRAKLDQDGYLT